MKRILTLALLASAFSIPAYAAGDNTGSASSGIGLSGTANVGANTGVGVNTNTGISAGTAANTNTGTSSGYNSNSSTGIQSNSNTGASTGLSDSTASDTSADSATGNTSVGGSFDSSTDTSTSITGENLNSNDVKLIQQALRQEGIFNGTADGVWGPRTANALIQFQQRNQLDTNGAIDTQTLDRLGVNLSSSASGGVRASNTN